MKTIKLKQRIKKNLLKEFFKKKARFEMSTKACQ